LILEKLNKNLKIFLRVSVCFHPRDNVLAIGISNELHLWDWWEDFKPFVTLKTGSDAEKILFCRFSPDGK